MESNSNKIPPWGWFLLLFLLTVAVGGVWYYTGLDDEDEGRGNKGDAKAGGGTDAGGGNANEDPTQHQTGYRISPELLQKILDAQQKNYDPKEKGRSAENPLYYRATRAIELIRNQAELLALNSEALLQVRTKYLIGKGLLVPDARQQKAIDWIFFDKLGLHEVTNEDVEIVKELPNKWILYPVTSSYEPKGLEYKKELKRIVDVDWKKLNLTDLRHPESPWWAPKLGINFLVGTTVYDTPTAHTIWMGYAQWDELTFYRQMNGLGDNVTHLDLADAFVDKYNSHKRVLKGYPNARSAYCATRMQQWAADWAAEIVRYDRALEYAALSALQLDGWHFTFINPDTGIDEISASSNPYADFLRQDGKTGGGNKPPRKLET